MKKLVIIAVAVAGTLGISSYSIGKTTPNVTPSKKQNVNVSVDFLTADTIMNIRAGRANLAQAD